MGFNDWNAFGCDVDEQLIEQTADLFVSSGLSAAGYRYVNIDDCWSLRERDPSTGRLVPDPAKFPSGIAGVADYVHSKGLKLGIYADAGTNTCAGFPGSLGHEELDASTFAS
jgi:alpha-galactosidase